MVGSPIGRVLPRHAERTIRDALEDTRVVLVNGARQSGKSTLLRQFAPSDAAEWRDLDLPLVRQAAVADSRLIRLAPAIPGAVFGEAE